MSIESKISPSGESPQIKKPWVTPAIQVLDMETARFGNLSRGKDGIRRS